MDKEKLEELVHYLGRIALALEVLSGSDPGTRGKEIDEWGVLQHGFDKLNDRIDGIGQLLADRL